MEVFRYIAAHQPNLIYDVNAESLEDAHAILNTQGIIPMVVWAASEDIEGDDSICKRFGSHFAQERRSRLKFLQVPNKTSLTF